MQILPEIMITVNPIINPVIQMHFLLMMINTPKIRLKKGETMETNVFDSRKSIEGLAQFDAAAANSALMFSANFITQVDALSASLQGMADMAAAALTAAFSTGATAMSESVGTSILDITTKIQGKQQHCTK